MKPNFLVIGAMKSATTSLWKLLDQHPCVFMSKVLEPSFFSDDRIYGNGWDWYEGLFSQANGAQAVGEESTAYTKRGLYPHTVERIVRHIPDARLIYILRHPLERIESHWMHDWLCDNNRSPFTTSVRTLPEMIEISRYWEQLSAYREFFPDERLLVLFYEDFKENAAREVQRCFRFLGVDPDMPLTCVERRYNVSRQRRPDGALLSALKKWRGTNGMVMSIKEALPERWHGPVKRLLKQSEGVQRPTWDEATRAWVIDQIHDDARTVLEFGGKPKDYWRF